MALDHTPDKQLHCSEGQSEMGAWQASRDKYGLTAMLNLRDSHIYVAEYRAIHRHPSQPHKACLPDNVYTKVEAAAKAGAEAGAASSQPRVAGDADIIIPSAANSLVPMIVPYYGALTQPLSKIKGTELLLAAATHIFHEDHAGVGTSDAMAGPFFFLAGAFRPA